MTLNAPSDPTATFPGVLFFQDPRAAASGVDKLNGGSTMNLGGAIYFPAQQVQFSGNDAAGGAKCTVIVARLVTFTGNSSIVDSNCPAAGVTPIQVTGIQFSG